MRIIFRRLAEDLTVENLIKQVAYYAVWVLGSLLPLTLSGLNPQTLVTASSLARLASALQRHYLKFHQCILILTLRPFRLGDQIIVGETEGNVERIELRATTANLRWPCVVPNAEVFTSLIINNTAAPIRRGSGTIYWLR